MPDTKANKNIFIFDNLLLVWLSITSSKNPPKGKERGIAVCKLIDYFAKKKFSLIEDLRIKSSNCFKHQINDAVLWKFLPLSNQSWVINNQYAVTYNSLQILSIQLEVYFE